MLLLAIPCWHCPMNTFYQIPGSLNPAAALPCHQPAWSACHPPEKRRDALRTVLRRDTGLIQSLGSLEHLASPPTGHGSRADVAGWRSCAPFHAHVPFLSKAATVKEGGFS